MLTTSLLSPLKRLYAKRNGIACDGKERAGNRHEDLKKRGRNTAKKGDITASIFFYPFLLFSIASPAVMTIEAIDYFYVFRNRIRPLTWLVSNCPATQADDRTARKSTTKPPASIFCRIGVVSLYIKNTYFFFLI
jgi:hypothetical protein